MWIHSIRLLNFKSYKEAAFSFPEPKNGQNIVLIGAMNGHGKTTLLEAVYLCLYDTDAVSHLQRAGLNSKDINYPNFLQAALHHKASPQYGRYRIELEIEIRQRRQGKICGLKIRRKWHFNEKRQFERESTETRADVLVDDRYLPVDLAELDKYLNTYALPFDYAPFFFFDGEKIVQAAERSGTGMWLNTALKGLLGVTLLTRLAASLGDYRRRCISENAGQKMQEDLERAENALASAQAQYDVFREEWEKIQQEWAHWDSERSRLQQQLGGGSDIRTSQDLLMQRERLEKEMDDFNAKIKAAVKAMPLAFLPSDGLNVLKGKSAGRFVGRTNADPDYVSGVGIGGSYPLSRPLRYRYPAGTFGRRPSRRFIQTLEWAGTASDFAVAGHRNHSRSVLPSQPAYQPHLSGGSRIARQCGRMFARNC